MLLSELPSNTACPCLPQVDHLIRAANRLCQSKRPQDPKDLEFILQEGHLPANFLQADVKMRSRRHLIFATAGKLKILSKAKQWYVDGTFKLCRKPFTQLFTINAFTRQDIFVKKAPLVYVLMSGRRKRDYKRVLNEILELLPYAPRVKEVNTFEACGERLAKSSPSR